MRFNTLQNSGVSRVPKLEYGLERLLALGRTDPVGRFSDRECWEAAWEHPRLGAPMQQQWGDPAAAARPLPELEAATMARVSSEDLRSTHTHPHVDRDRALTHVDRDRALV